VTEALQEVVEAAKAVLVQATHLAHPVPAATLALVTDASDTHMGAILQQLEGCHWLSSPRSFLQILNSNTPR
jgi:RNase H-like domain found in reverse transcriptase